MFHSFIVVVGLLFGLWSAVAETNTKVLVPEHRITLGKTDLAELERHADTSIRHLKSMFEAIHTGQPTFTHVETKKTLTGDLTDFENVRGQAFHTTTTKGTFFANKKYLSLDDARVLGDIAAMGENSLIYCGGQNLEKNDYVLGTNKGEWFKKFKAHANPGASTEFVLSRQVESSSSISMAGKTCQNVQTSAVHPLQVTEHVLITSEIQHPFSVSGIPSEDEVEGRKLGKANWLFGSPDAPLVLCDSKTAMDRVGEATYTKALWELNPSYEDSGTAGTTAWAFGIDRKGNECISVEPQMPGSFNYNYDWNKNRAVQPSTTLTSGVVCNNCYSFLGASVLAVVNIWGGKAATLAFEVKQMGGMGYNLELQIKDPSITVSKYIVLAQPSSQRSTVPIYGPLMLKFGFGGASATVEGTGSIKGSGSFGSGYSLRQTNAVLYKNGGWSSYYKTQTSINPTKATGIGAGKINFSTLRASIKAAVSAKVIFELGAWGGPAEFMKVAFSSTLTATGQFIYAKAGAAATTMSLDVAAAANRRDLKSNKFWDELMGKHNPSSSSSSSASSHSQSYYPGDKMAFSVDYKNMNPGEKHLMLFSLHSDKDQDPEQGMHILVHHFTTSASGNGREHVEWTVPHNLLMNQDQGQRQGQWHAAVRCTAHGSKRFHSQRKFRMLHSRRTEHMRGKPEVWSFPRAGSMCPAEKKHTIRWDKHALRSFKTIPGTDGWGRDADSVDVSIIIVAEDDNGQRTAFDVANAVPNTGFLDGVVFPQTLRQFGRRFFMVLHDGMQYTRMGWNEGYFQITPPIAPLAALPAPPVPGTPAGEAGGVAGALPPMEPGPVMLGPPATGTAGSSGGTVVGWPVACVDCGPSAALNASTVPPPVVDEEPLWATAAPVGDVPDSAAPAAPAAPTTSVAPPAYDGNNLRRQLQAFCPSNLYLSLGISFSFDGVYVLTLKIPVSSATSPTYTLVPAQKTALC